MIKLTISGNVDKVYTIKESNRNSRPWFMQTVILHQPKEEYKGTELPEEFFVISIISSSKTDSRFLNDTHLQKPMKCSVYLKGERWSSGNRGDYNFNHKLNLQEWTS